MDKTTVLVTGGSGFIGAHLVEKLLSNNFKVISLDNYVTGSEKNINSIVNENLEIIKHDINEEIDINYDIVFNLASRASPKDFGDFPIDILRTNSIGVLNILESAKKNNAILVQASTSEVYGDPIISPQDENYKGNVSSTGIRSCYDEGKRFAEAMIFAYYRKFDIDVRLARIFNTYGPKMRNNDGRVIPNFFIQAIKNDDLTIQGDGMQTRSFCYVDDLVNGLLKIMQPNAINLKGQIFNLGNPKPMTILDLAKKIIKLTKSNSELIFKELPEDDPMIRCPDISKAMSVLKWKPIVELDEGLEFTYKYFLGNN